MTLYNWLNSLQVQVQLLGHSILERSETLVVDHRKYGLLGVWVNWEKKKKKRVTTFMWLVPHDICEIH